METAQQIASGLLGPLANIGQFTQTAEAQVPSAGLTITKPSYTQSRIYSPSLPKTVTTKTYQPRGFESSQAKSIRLASASTFKESFSQYGKNIPNQSIGKSNALKSLDGLQLRAKEAAAMVQKLTISRYPTPRNRESLAKWKRVNTNLQGMIARQKVVVNRFRF